MKNWLIVFLVLMLANIVAAQETKVAQVKRVTSQVDTVQENELMLVQSFEVQVPIEKVWEAYTTKEGWEGAFTAMAEVDWKINGTVKTNYNPAGTIGDSTTIVLNIINYIPEKMLTLQAELTEHFPDFMKKDSKDLFNIIQMEKINESSTKVISYGIGYKNNKKYLGLLAFFIQGNELSYNNLINYLENGVKAKY